MAEPKILSFSAGTVIEREPPGSRNIQPHSWLSEDAKRMYDERLRDHGYLELYISKISAEKMVNHSRRLAGAGKEALGFLLGDVCRSEGRSFTMVRDIVTGPLKSSSDRVRFDRESLSGLFRELDASGFDYVIVGWYHSHPGYGCFMSRLDRDTQATVFSESFHSSVVIDPVIRDIAAFGLLGAEMAPREFAIFWHDLETPYRRKVVDRKRIAKDAGLRKKGF